LCGARAAILATGWQLSRHDAADAALALSVLSEPVHMTQAAGRRRADRRLTAGIEARE